PRRLAGALEGDRPVGLRGAARLGPGAGDVDALGRIAHRSAPSLAGCARDPTAASSASSASARLAGRASRPKTAAKCRPTVAATPAPFAPRPPPGASEVPAPPGPPHGIPPPNGCRPLPPSPARPCVVMPFLTGPPTEPIFPPAPASPGTGAGPSVHTPVSPSI